MKKHIIAAAVAAAVAVPAMAQVTVYGLLDQSYQSVESKTAAGVKTGTTTFGGTGALSGGRLGFRGNEDLGGGLKAGFVLETGVTGNDGNFGGAAARLSFLELSGGFGTVRAGRQVTPQKAVMDTHYASGNSAFAAGLPGVTMDVDGERVSSAFTYITPTMSGLSAQVQMAGATSDADNAANKTSSEQANFGVSYSAGPLSIGIGINSVDAKTEAGTQTENTFSAIGASYNFGVASLHITNSRLKTETVGTAINAEAEETSFGIRYPLGSLTLVAQISDGESNPAASVTKTSFDGYQLHAIYSLSKRTNVYALYGNDDSQASGAAAATRNGFALGVRHSF